MERRAQRRPRGRGFALPLDPRASLGFDCVPLRAVGDGRRLHRHLSITLGDNMSNVRSDPRARRVEPTPVKVRLELRAGLNDVGKQSRSYVQQITGRNEAKTPSRTGIVYDWLVANPDKL